MNKYALFGSFLSKKKWLRFAKQNLNKPQD